MKKHIITAIVLAAAISTLFGCNNNEGMGSDMMPDNDMANVVIDRIDVEAYTEFETPLLSANLSYMMLGKFKDDLFGTTVASFAAKFSNSSYGTFNHGDKCDRLVLTLGVDTTAAFLYGDSLTDVTVDVYRLGEVLADSIKYYDSDYDDGTGKYAAAQAIKYDKARRIATTTFKPTELDSMITFEVEPWYGDTIIKHSLSTSFDANITGLYFKVSAGNSIIRFSRASNYTQYVLYLAKQDEASKADSVIFSIQSTDCSVNMMAHDYSGTTVAQQKSNIQDEYLYLQGMTGTRIRIDLSGVDKIQQGKHFSLRGAYLEAQLADSAYSQQKKFPAIDNIVCAGIYKEKRDSLIYFTEFLTGDSNPTLNILGRNTTTNTYSVNLTGRVNDLLYTKAKGEEPIYDIYIFPSGRTTDFNRSVICSPAHKETPMKLVVEYINY